MVPLLYNFDYKSGVLDKKEYFVRDYFQYYTSGVENIIENNPDFYDTHQREDNERTEVTAYQEYQNPNLSDLLLGVNNQVYLWSAPRDSEMIYYTLELRMKYIESLMKDHINVPGVREGIEERVKNTLELDDMFLRKMIIPKKGNVQSVLQQAKRYFKDRTLTGDSDD